MPTAALVECVVDCTLRLWFAKTLADFEINEIAAALPAPVLL